MKKTIQTLTLTVAAIGLTAGAAIAADETRATGDQNTMGTQTQNTMDTQTQGTADTQAQGTTGTQAQGTMDAQANVQPSGAQVESVQASLAQEGYNVSVDGVWGPQTADALRQFQQANSLDATGEIDARTLAALNVDASASQGTAMGESRNW